MWIVQLALRRPYTFVVITLLLLLAAPLLLRKMPTDIFPRIDIPVVAVLWQYNGLSAKEMADRITTPSERGLALTVTDMEHTESQSLNGLSVIKVFFQPGTDIRTSLAQVLSATTTAQRSLPAGIMPAQVDQLSATELPVLQLGISSQTLSESEVGDLAGNAVRQALVTIPGASVTNPYGIKSRQVSVDLDSAALLARGLTPNEVVTAIGAQNLILPTGTLKLGASEYDVSLNGALGSIAQIGDVPLRSNAQGTVYVRDVAQVRDGYAPQTTLVRQNGERGVLMSVFKKSSVSTLSVIDAIQRKLPEIRREQPELAIQPMFDQSLFVRAAVGNVLREGLIAAALTAAMILLFLGNWRSTFIIALTIPLAILCSLLGLHLIGQTLNLMTLGGLALAVGVLVDDATVEIENIERQMALGKPPRQAILDGAAEIAQPALVSTLSICVVFLPLFFLTGVTRHLFVPLAEAVMFAMLASYLISRTLIPTLVLYLLRDAHSGRMHWPLQQRFERGFARLQRGYRVLLAALLLRRARFVPAFLLICLATTGLFPLLGQELFPEVDAGQLRLHVRAPSGTRIEAMPALIDRIEASIRELIPADELGNVLDIVGGPYSPRNTLYGNSGTAEASDSEIMLSLAPEHRRSSQHYMRLLRRELPQRFAQTEFFFQSADQVSQSLNFGTPAPVDIQIAGNRSAENLKLAYALHRELRAIPGVVDSRVYQRAAKPVLRLDMDRDQLQALGLNARDLAQNLLVSLSGSMQTTPSYWLNPANGNTYNVGVQSRELDLDSLDALLRTPVGAQAGGAPQLLGNLVQVRREAQSAVVSRYDSKTVIDIHANIDGRDLGRVGADIEALLARYRPQLPATSSISLRGQYPMLRSSYQGLYAGLALAVLLVYLLIVINFQSWLDPLIVMATLPAALAGIIWLLFLSGTALSVPALTGAIMTIGVATANAILLVSFARERLAAGAAPAAAALAAGVTRLRPVLMTALAMIVGMLPMALGLGEGGEQNAPLGRAVIGGLLLATCSTLLLVPALFTALHEARARRWSAVSLVPRPESATP